jgi:peptide/nickel transport system substrate-binding protein
MNKNIYGNTVLTILLFAILIFGLAIVKSTDLKRLREERISKQLQKIEERLNSLAGNLRNRRLNVPSPADQKESLSEENGKDIANYAFFDQNAEFGGRRISATASETKNMNYLVNNESLVASLWSYCNDSLAERNYKNPALFQPMLAESWSLSDDKLTYTIKLKKGILWHDFVDPVTGKEWKNVEVTANDFKFYIDVVKNKDTDCAPIRTYLVDLDKIEVINKYEFKVIWKKKYFLSESITLGMSPLPEHLYHAYKEPFDGKKFNDDHKRNRIIVGCGPYQFAGWKKGQRIKLKRFEGYYGKRYGVAPPVSNIVLEVIKHKNTQFQALLSEDIDEMDLTPDQWVKRTDIPAFGKNGYIKKLKYPARMYRYIGYNLKNPLFQDKRVRQALTHLVDRNRIVKEVYHDLARVITGNFFIGTPYNDKSIKPYSFSLKKALSLLTETGWKDTNDDGILDKGGKDFEFTMLSSSGNPNYDKILPMIKEDMAKAGIVMNIKKVEWSVFVQAIGAKKFEACICGWGMGFESDPYQLWHSSQADIPESSNHVGFKNKEADRIIGQIRTCFNLKKRIELCHQFHKIIHEEQPYTFLFSRDALIAINGRYKNLRLFPSGLATNIIWTPKNKQKRIIP